MRVARWATAMCGALLTLLTSRAEAAGTLTVCSEAAPEGFDIVQYELNATNDAAGVTLYDTLVRVEPGGTKLAPGLAERWDISSDGLTYTFHLRKGVKFHTTPWFKPTRDFDADDVVWSFDRLRDKSHPAHASARNGYPYWSGLELGALIGSVAKVDDMTVRFTLKRPNAPFLATLSAYYIGAIYPAEYGAQLAKAGKLEALNTQPVGSGPFVLRSYQKDAQVRYDAHPAHWAGRPAVDRLIFAVTVDTDVRVQRVKAGECLVGHPIKPSSVAAFLGSSTVSVLRNSPLAISFLALNVQHKPLADVRLRQALWLAIDKKTYIQANNAGFATPAVSFLPPAIWSHDKSLQDRADVERARALVKASGYDGSPLTMFFGTGGERNRAAELLQADWAKAGVTVKVIAMELGEMFKRAGQGEHDILLMSSYGDINDPDNFFGPNLSCAAAALGGSNKSRWCNPRFDALLDAANRTTDIARRTDLYVQAQRLVYDEVPVVPLVYPMVMTALNQRVTGFVASPLNIADFRSVSVKP